MGILGLAEDVADGRRAVVANARDAATATWVRTDAHGLIGRKYLNAGWGNRVCQIYADSRDWDTRHYPRGFFDSAFIDGGHAYDVVANDTQPGDRAGPAGRTGHVARLLSAG